MSDDLILTAIEIRDMVTFFPNIFSCIYKAKPQQYLFYGWLTTIGDQSAHFLFHKFYIDLKLFKILRLLKTGIFIRYKMGISFDLHQLAEIKSMCLW